MGQEYQFESVGRFGNVLAETYNLFNTVRAAWINLTWTWIDSKFANNYLNMSRITWLSLNRVFKSRFCSPPSHVTASPLPQHLHSTVPVWTTSRRCWSCAAWTSFGISSEPPNSLVSPTSSGGRRTCWSCCLWLEWAGRSLTRRK